jgi:Questin oxidase-like
LRLWEPAIQHSNLLGLACAAVHKTEQTELVPPSFFVKLPDPGLLTGLTSKFSVLRVSAPDLEEKRPTFAFLRRIRDHQKLGRGVLSYDPFGDPQYTTVVTNVGDSIVALVSEWADQWLEDTRSDEDVEKRLVVMVEEVVWGNVIWFGVGGWQARGSGDRLFNADFFVCVQLFLHLQIVLIHGSAHLVTSAIFLLSLVVPSEHLPYPPVPLASRLTLLKAYLATCAGWYISRGNGLLPIKEFYSATHDRLTAPPAIPAPPSASRKPLSGPGGPWERIIANSIAHPDEHLSKAVRSFATFATLWGGRPAGYFAGGGEDGLEGREVLDGTLFVRAASLTLDRLGWAHESGKDLGRWDRDGFAGSSENEALGSAYL